MEAYEVDDLFLVDHINKCRCCFGDLTNDQNTVSISRAIEQTFFNLTQVQVSKSSTNYMVNKS